MMRLLYQATTPRAEGEGHYSYTTRVLATKSEFAVQTSKYNIPEQMENMCEISIERGAPVTKRRVVQKHTIRNVQSNELNSFAKVTVNVWCTR